MWQNLLVLGLVAAAVGYVIWNIYRGITKAAGGSCGGGCGSCGSKTAGGENLIQLTTTPSPDETPATAKDRSEVSSQG
ncbi:FeoB-associated Cys-rich membrane protein [Bremerella cremea]|uniref:FeoB-associated Cys-rich membrane protein n=1 Tax=Bremerella cremea TaxID=1031537 RepID=A0A368KYP8_9BACT|nr:FeoB-associated Cys-rich membrane protein [Bremerella cremea]RCS54774.1 FeoB-associated Cys-rich membrane protein [Bremerella cremea]